MKKIFATATTLFMLTAFSGNAQTAKKSDVRFGLRAGVNISNIIKTSDKNFTTDLKPGFNAAAFLEIPVVKSVSFQPEFQFSQKGYVATQTSVLGSSSEYRVTTNFVEVPLLLKLTPTNNFGIVVGPQYSFLTSTNTKFKTQNSTYENTVNQDNSNLRKNILGGVLGIEVTSSNAIFSLRYSLDFQSNNGDGTSNTPKYKNQVLGLSIGFRL